jgi:Mn2+/Fe2+ NRAMP family transporter
MVVIQAISARIGRTTGHAVLGTTISPYRCPYRSFWRAAQEVGDTKAEPVRRAAAPPPKSRPRCARTDQLDTSVGIGMPNLVALAILATTAATLHAGGVHDLTSAAQTAEALRPIAGRVAFAHLPWAS